jgi:hypothetical protein
MAAAATNATATAVDATQVNDFSTVLKQAFGEFKEESIPKARVRRLYFVKRDQLKTVVSSIRVVIPSGTKASSVPSGVAADKWKWLIDNLALAEKWLKDELKKVPANTPMPPEEKPHHTGGKTKIKQRSRRKESRDDLKKTLISVYGEKKGKLRYKVYEKMAKDIGKEGSPGYMYALFAGRTTEALAESIRASTASAQSGATSSDAASDTALPVDTAVVAQVPASGISAMLWPTDKPIYKRPAAIIGVAAVVGIVGWMVLSTPKKPGTALAKVEPAK